MPIMTMKHYTRELIKEHPDWYFIFGDNWAQKGLGGQAAAAQGEPNSIGVPTKKAPTYMPEDFLSDETYTSNIVHMIGPYLKIRDILVEGKTVVWPADGIGTGIADLPNRAPETLKFINCVIESLKKIYGEVPCT